MQSSDPSDMQLVKLTVVTQATAPRAVYEFECEDGVAVAAAVMSAKNKQLKCVQQARAQQAKDGKKGSPQGSARGLNVSATAPRCVENLSFCTAFLTLVLFPDMPRQRSLSRTPPLARSCFTKKSSK